MKAARLLVVAVLMLALVAVAASAATAGGRRPVPRVAAIELTPFESGGPQGVAYLKQVGQRLTGWIVVWGLAPGTTHAWHVHGPNGACRGTQRNPVASDDDLVADANGVAFVKFSTTSTFRVIRRGFYLNVHQLASADGAGAGITCGDIRRAV